MARKRERVFALTMALLFFVTGFGFSFWVILQLVTQKSTNSSNTSSNTTSSTCSGTPAELALSPPALYKPVTLPTSLQSTDLIKGSGAAAQSGDCLIVKYYGTLASTGIVFDEDFTTPKGFEFKLGAGQVIPGWDQGLVGLRVGGERRLVIPPALAYGSSGQGPIPANSTLVFVVKLLAIK